MVVIAPAFAPAFFPPPRRFRRDRDRGRAPRTSARGARNERGRGTTSDGRRDRPRARRVWTATRSIWASFISSFEQNR
eukprot:31286-Pelagococcus_subviridis.AAC.13